jgi:hypothetical protein
VTTGGPIVAGVVVVAAVSVFAVFVSGGIVAVMSLAAVAIRREDRSLTLTEQAPNWLLRGVRRLMGVGLRNVDPEFARVTKELVRQ